MSNPKPRHGSLQFYPRSRAKRILPRVSWNAIHSKDSQLQGFIGYKVGMKSAFVKDNTPNSLTKGKRIILPVTIIECPTIKILSVRFYKDNIVAGEVLSKNIDKEIKRKFKTPKNYTKNIEDFEKSKEFDDVRVVVYSQVKKTNIKKSPDIKEIGLTGTLEQKLAFIKNNLSKEMSVKEVMKDTLVDVRGVTKGKGLQGTIKRFGITLKAHKSEKGQRTLGSGGPWHPARVDFHQPRAGQMGFFTRASYNSKVILVGNPKEREINPSNGFKNFGKVVNDYIIVEGSIMGPAKRPVLITAALRPAKAHSKKSYEFIELR
ncbi:MAG: 50S ribosomal protein L3 [Candidatus Pacearchaeota archaeon]|jgi:large subunit ribosomal protein L3